MMTIKTIWSLIPAKIKNRIYIGLSCVFLLLVLVYLLGFNTGFEVCAAKCAQKMQEMTYLG